MELLKEENFNSTINGAAVKLFTLRNKNSCVAQYTNYGARWLSMWVPDREGKWSDVVLGFDDINTYLKAKEKYYGAVVGRVCGRIGGGRFALDGVTYSLSRNDIFGNSVKNHLHGGVKGFSFQVWDAKLEKHGNGEEVLVLRYVSKDGEEGYPGNLEVEVTYTLSNDNAVHIRYKARCDQPTLVNLTNHAYFNLSGGMCSNVLEHCLFVNADKAVGCNDNLIPTGHIIPVENTPIDFTYLRPIGSRICESFPGQLFSGKGYAVSYVLNESSTTLQLAGIVEEKVSGRAMELYSDQPVIQFYNAWLFDGTDVGKGGRRYVSSSGLALEAHGFPDAPNHSEFPSIVLLPGEEYRQTTIYKFLNK